MRLRSPTLDDAPAVLEVLVARDVADLGAPDYTLADLQDEWRGNELDLTADAVVTEDRAARIVGYAVVRRRGTLAVVRPDHEGRGIGAQLLAWAQARDRDENRERHRQWAGARNARGRALLAEAGCRRARSHWRDASLARCSGSSPRDKASPSRSRRCATGVFLINVSNDPLRTTP